MPKIRFDRENCIGCGSCTNICPAFWQMGEDHKSKLKGAKEKDGWFELEIKKEDLECNKNAAGSCPASVIHVEE